MNFEERIRSYIPDEFEAFRQSLETPVAQSLRLNTSKMDPETFLKETDIPLGKPSPFTHDAWYVQGSFGNHPWHQAGLFYLQEPSASAPVDILDVHEDDLVLDLCAAPGSKSTQIARELKTGFLCANEIDRKRAQILLGNLERSGFPNILCTSMDPASLCRQFPGFFTKILVDAPCSGEGMIKKHEAALNQWSEDNIRFCARRQADILDEAVQALAPGGRLLYSTCTYAREENEETVHAFLQRHPDMKQIPIEKSYGRPDLDGAGGLRIFPMDGGEGQFAALFEKAENNEERKKPKAEPGVKLTKTEAQFLQSQCKEPFAYYWRKGDELFASNRPFLKVRGNVLCQGVRVGTTVKNRFEPAQAFFLSQPMLRSETITSLDARNMDAFFHGMQVPVAAEPGWRTIAWKAIPAGFGKSTGTAINNKFPKGLRYPAGSHIPEVHS